MCHYLYDLQTEKLTSSAVILEVVGGPCHSLDLRAVERNKKTQFYYCNCCERTQWIMDTARLLSLYCNDIIFIMSKSSAVRGYMRFAAVYALRFSGTSRVVVFLSLNERGHFIQALFRTDVAMLMRPSGCRQQDVVASTVTNYDARLRTTCYVAFWHH